jgi:uncharacterized protein YbjT (DUF2867 family)
MRILIVGASGGTGRQAVVAALSRGHTVRAWSRAHEELAFMHPRLERIAGDVRDVTLATQAIAGVDAVICALGSTEGLKPTRICAEGTRSLVTAMKHRSVRRIVAVTSMGTTQKLGPVHVRLLDPLLFHRIYDDKRNQEAILRASGFDWTIVRPGRLTDDPDRRRAVASLEGPIAGVLLPRASLARFLVEEVERPSFLHMAPYLAEHAFARWHRLLTLSA